MNIENLSTLKIHKLTQAQYDRELAAGNIDQNALYLTPNADVDLSGYATEAYVDNAVSDSVTATSIKNALGYTPFSTNGGELSGNLSIKKATSPQVILNNTTTGRFATIIADSDGGTTVSNHADDNNVQQLKVRPETAELKNSVQLLRKVNGGSAKYYNLYGEHNKTEMVEAVKVSMDGIPSYWQTALDNGVEAINTALCEAGRNKSAFLFYSDAHWNYGSQMSPTLLKYLYKHTGMAKTFFGGDIVNDEATDYDTMDYLWEWRKQIKDLPNHHSVVGNHDDGNSTNNLFSEQYVYGYLLGAEETHDMVMGDGLYYYVDSPAEKTRYLCLDTGYKDLSALSAEQSAFITETLKTTQSGWHIVVVSHIWYMPDYNQYSVRPIPITGLSATASSVATILDNYNSRSGVFADCGAWVEFCIGGHVHRDYVGTTTGGIPIVVVETDSNHIRSELSYTAGTTTEASVNGIVADYSTNTLNVVRIGRGNSFTVDLSTGVSTDIPGGDEGGNEPGQPTYTNVLDTVGWVEGVRLSGGDGGERENKNSDGTAKTDASGFIPMTTGQRLYLKNVAWHLNDSGYGGFVAIFKADKTLISGFYLTDATLNDSAYNMEVDENGYITKIRLNFSDMAFVRIVALNIDENSIITVDEPIE